MKKHYKYILDLIMTIIMILLMKIVFIGILWHELLGLGIFFLFFIHNILNFKCLEGVLKKFSSKICKTKLKLGIVLDILLSIIIIGITITGIMISKELFPFALTGFVSSLHHSLSYLALILISVHIGLHWLEIMSGFRKLFRLETLNKGRTYFLRVVTIFIVILGIKGSFNQDISGKLLEVVKTSDDKTESDNLAIGYSTSETNGDEEEHGTGRHKNRSDDEEKTTHSNDTTTTTAPGSLEDYLSKLYCNGCSRHCPLSAPQCGVGEQQAIEASFEYYKEAEAIGEPIKSITVGEVLMDYLPMMGLFIAGTHYLVMIPKYLKEREL